MSARTVAIAALVGLTILLGLRQAFLVHTRRPSTAVILSKSTHGVYVERWHLLWNPNRLMIVLHRFSGLAPRISTAWTPSHPFPRYFVCSGAIR